MMSVNVCRAAICQDRFPVSISFFFLQIFITVDICFVLSVQSEVFKKSIKLTDFEIQSGIEDTTNLMYFLQHYTFKPEYQTN